MLKEYVLVYCERLIKEKDSLEVLLVQKNKPSIQKGFYNLPGGAVEKEENPTQAAERELFEETGYRVKEIFKIGIINDIGDNYLIHVFCSILENPFCPVCPRKEETEIADWLPLFETLKSPKLIPNLRVIIPLIRGGALDWTIDAKLLHVYDVDHNLSIKFPTYQSKKDNLEINNTI